VTVPAVLHPGVTSVLRDVLAHALEVPVGRRVPHPRPSRFVVVARFGGARATEVTDGPRLGVEAWAPDPDEAETLAGQARRVLDGLAGTTVDGVIFYRVLTSSPEDLPHPSGHPRSTFTADLHVRAVP